jgi:hypothetical protein
MPDPRDPSVAGPSDACLELRHHGTFVRGNAPVRPPLGCDSSVIEGSVLVKGRSAQDENQTVLEQGSRTYRAEDTGDA